MREPKRVGSALFFGFDWADGGANDGASTDPGWLQGDTIASSSWAFTGPDTALVLAGDTNSTTQTSVKISAGTAGANYRVKNTITTSGAETDSRTVIIQVIP
jgi:hypothetical protein